MRIVFMGTPDFSVPALDALAAAGHEIAAVYTQPPRPAGRGQKDRPSPVHLRAEALGLPSAIRRRCGRPRRRPTSRRSTPTSPWSSPMA
jgi:methionyl-tRNA formyltransferase